MATINAYTSVDMLYGQLGSNSLYDFGSLTIAKSSHFQISYFGEALNFYGSFSYSGGQLAGGNITDFNYTNSGFVEFEAFDFNIDVYTLVTSQAPELLVVGGSDTISGSNQDDVLASLDGDDLINGNGGIDLIYGGQGNDTINGGSENDRLYGEYGNDRLNGGLGIDSMFGGLGNDIYYVNSRWDVVFEEVNSGTDTIYSSAPHYSLANNVERLFLTGTSNISATGNNEDNILTGNSGDNIIKGLAGNDRINGMQGADSMFPAIAPQVICQ